MPEVTNSEILTAKLSGMEEAAKCCDERESVYLKMFQDGGTGMISAGAYLNFSKCARWCAIQIRRQIADMSAIPTSERT